jgi:RND family efflux transporter MFP subunit
VKNLPQLPRKVVVPALILAFGSLATLGLVTTSPQLSTRKPQDRSPLVRTVRAQVASVTLQVHTQGTVVPRTESDLVAEVSGRIIEVSPSLASGGFLEPDEILVTIDPSDYEIAVERARASLARSESRLGLAQAALRRQKRLVTRNVGSSADLETASSNAQVAEADVRDAGAALRHAENELERTRVRVPFAGRVRQKKVDVGQYVNRGTPVARVYAVDYAEVRLPIPDSDAAFLDLPIDYRGGESSAPSPRVLLRASFAGRDYTWHGRIVRTEGELDPKTRMIHAVARIEDPYGRGDDPDRPPLAVGLFVEAEIVGRVIPDVVRLPRAALRGSNEIAVVDDAGRVQLRQVEVLRRDRHHVLVTAGIASQERVIAGPLAVAVNGMRVRVLEQPQERSPSGGEELSTSDVAAGRELSDASYDDAGSQL